MKCFRIDLSKKLLPYIHGRLSPNNTKKIEQHLLHCNSCKTKTNRLLEGDTLAQLIPAVSSKEDSWAKIENAIANQPPHPNSSVHPSILRICAAISVLSIVAFFGWTVGRSSSATAANFLSEKYREVAIGEMSSNTEPHVVTEGYISEVRVDHKDGDLTFKLVESLERPSPFVICEIIPPSNLSPPQVGHRVRVYGVSRYDAKENHQWYEVHPVVGIEKVD